jgi:hypothetical protein
MTMTTPNSGHTLPTRNSEHNRRGLTHHHLTKRYSTQKLHTNHNSFITSTMKLHLLLLISLFNVSSGFMAELKGTLAEEACTGSEYADFKQCVTADVSMVDFIDFEDESFVNRDGDSRRLSCMGCPTSGAPRGTWCFVMCGSGRRLLEEVTDMPNLRRLVQPDEFTAVFGGGELTGNGRAKQVAKTVIECFETLSENHPCLGSTVDMTLTVTL